MTSQDRPAYLFTTRLRCPRCGSSKLWCYKTLHQGDGSDLRYSRCQQCKTPIRIVIEDDVSNSRQNREDAA